MGLLKNIAAAREHRAAARQAEVYYRLDGLVETAARIEEAAGSGWKARYDGQTVSGAELVESLPRKEKEAALAHLEDAFLLAQRSRPAVRRSAVAILDLVQGKA